MNSIPRCEHPNPQFERENWQNLNGSWDFEIDGTATGKEKGFFKNDYKLKNKITVPFCPESRLSGVEYKDFIPACWYKKTVEISKEQLSNRCILHFGAVDYECELFVNEKSVGTHRGGYIGFEFEITTFLNVGENTLCLYVRDWTREGNLPSGKQSFRYNSFGCFYTRTTGIWQTVWMEFVPENYVKNVKMTADIADSAIVCEATVKGNNTLIAAAFFKGEQVGCVKVDCKEGTTLFSLPLSKLVLWNVGEGNLYDIEFLFGNDRVKSYFGMREIKMDGYKFRLNGRSVFQRLVLDQGFYPDGVYTAPTEEDLVNDIKLSLALGFNGARLHEKIFEPRFIYHCDRLGYMVWGEYPDWGLRCSGKEAFSKIIPEWCEEVKRDYNHPAIIGWCPRNESTLPEHTLFNDVIYSLTKQLDPYRPCIDASGGIHGKTDIFDTHLYEQDPVKFAEVYADVPNSIQPKYYLNEHCTYNGEPHFVSEYGGTSFNVTEGNWGYGSDVNSEEEFIERFKGLTECQLNHPYLFGLCYTQLTDVEQEQNGLYHFDRKPKFDVEKIRKILTQKAAIED